VLHRVLYPKVHANGIEKKKKVVEYFFRLQFSDTAYSLALVSVFSPPDQEILELSNHAAYICHRGGTDTLTVVEAKAISAVVSMVPDYQVTADGDIIIPENTFSMMEALFFTCSRIQVPMYVTQLYAPQNHMIASSPHRTCCHLPSSSNSAVFPQTSYYPPAIAHICNHSL
jgi:hypothetical protein